MPFIDVEYEGELHCSITHELSGSVIATDAPPDNQGKGETFSPTDLLAASLASCIATVLGIYAQRKQWDLRGMRLRIEKKMSQNPPRRVEALLTEVWMPISFNSEE